MRLLIACQECHRQYDASGLDPGRRVRCHCGEVIVVEAPRGHEANIVRCSSCGAPREASAPACVHCRSDFTLHELDMQTVCPNCLTRVSDRASYCHSCGCKLSAEMVAGDIKPLPCPACEDGPHMRSRKLGKQKISVMECDRCAGLWMENQSFGDLTSNAAAKAAHQVVSVKTPRVELPGLRLESGTNWSYRKCPTCKKLMTRRQYGKGSGVILDSCREHGTWFDAQELPAILAWIRAGGQRWTTEQLTREATARRRTKKKHTSGGMGPLEGDSSDKWSRRRWGGGTFTEILIEIFNLP